MVGGKFSINVKREGGDSNGIFVNITCFLCFSSHKLLFWTKKLSILAIFCDFFPKKLRISLEMVKRGGHSGLWYSGQQKVAKNNVSHGAH